MIEVEHLTKSYGKGRAVNDITFTVNKGEILGFLGPNGAGKTTTMRILTGYLPATAGTARIAGFDVFDQSMEVRKRIGYLPEQPPLYPEMSVADYLTFVARIKGVEADKTPGRVAEAMRMANIEDRRNDLIRKLSRGYKQRVGIAQAIVHNPDVVILDEPTVGLDPNQIIEVRRLIKSLAGDHTIILSTHILPEVEMTCDRVVIIHKGQIVAEDTPQNLASQRGGGQRIHLEVKGDAGQLQSSLAQVEGVSRVEVEPVESSGLLSVTLENDKGKDLRHVIASRLIGEGFELYELRAVNLSLEDIFRQLTTEETKEAQAA
ncbi:MAG TPA: ABC transporter ATP-binding protein [Blastocatellia bacterium]|nr:ABC transporter ATP-binding protein [Blastocatellia bacterium]